METTLDESFTKGFRFDKHRPKPGDKISLQVLDSNSVRMSLIVDGRTIRQRVIKFKLNDNYIQFKRNYVFSPVFLLINGIKNTDIRIGLLTNDNLLMDISWVTQGFLVIVPFTGERIRKYNLIYARRK
jgi:hypothetical protein